MKNAITSLLILNALSSLPQGTLSFTSVPLVGGATRAVNTVASSTPRSPTVFSTQLNGMVIGFFKRDKISDKTTELWGVDNSKSDAGGSVPAEAERGEEPSETKTLLEQVKQAGTAGAVSYALWELGFWGISIPVCVFGYRELTGHWPDFSNTEDIEKLSAEAFAFVNFARFAVPLRITLALSTTPWIDENVVQKFIKKDGDDE
mmetsp:Transcript_15723/g.33248  ORF Transcript_15723/g.33248 Transcript_15723/m.33248 type:complete len:204 (-) Transcript_15723:1865-2476(-)